MYGCDFNLDATPPYIDKATSDLPMQIVMPTVLIVGRDMDEADTTTSAPCIVTIFDP